MLNRRKTSTILRHTQELFYSFPANNFSATLGQNQYFLGISQRYGYVSCSKTQTWRQWDVNPGPVDSEPELLPLSHHTLPLPPCLKINISTTWYVVNLVQKTQVRAKMTFHSVSLYRKTNKSNNGRLKSDSLKQEKRFLTSRSSLTVCSKETQTCASFVQMNVLTFIHVYTQYIST